MLEIKDIDQTQLTDFFINDPKLCYLALPDKDLVSLYEQKQYYLNKVSDYKCIVNEDNKIWAVIKYELFTESTLNLHAYLPTCLHGKGNAKLLSQTIYDYIRDNFEQIKKVILIVPEPCKHVEYAANSFGMKLEGRITGSLMWRMKLVDMLIYGICIER